MSKKMDRVAAGMSGKKFKPENSKSEIKFFFWALVIVGGLCVVPYLAV